MGKKPGKKPTGRPPQVQAPKKGPNNVNSSKTPAQQNTAQAVEPNNDDEQSEAENGPDADVPGSSGAEAKSAQLGDQTKEEPKSSGTLEELKTGQDVGQETGDEPSEVENVLEAGVNNARGAEANGAGASEGILGAGPGEGDDNAEERAGVSSKETGAGVGDGNLGAGPGKGADDTEERAGVSSNETGAGAGEGNLGAGPGKGGDDTEERAGVSSNETGAGAGEGNPGAGPGKGDDDAEARAGVSSKENGVGVGEGNLGAGPGERGDDAKEKAGVSSKDTANDTQASNTDNIATTPVEGLAELIQVIEALGSAPNDDSPQVKADLVEKLKETPMFPAYMALQSSWRNMLARMSAMQSGRRPLPSPPLTPKEMSNKSSSDPQHRPQNPPSSSLRMRVDKTTQPTPPETAISIQPNQVVPPSDGKELKILQAEITSLSSKIDSMSQKMSKLASGEDVTKGLGVVDNKIGQAGTQTIEQVKTSARATKTQIDKVDNTVSQLSTRLDSGVSSLHQGLKQVQDSLAKRPAAPVPVTQNPRPEPKPDLKTGELETKVQQLHRVLDLTRAELLQADMAFKIALEGDLYEEADAAATGTASTSGMDSGRDTLQIAQGIRIRTVRLIARWRTLVSLVVGGHGSADANLGIMEGEWGRCVDHLQARDLIVRKAVKEKNEAFRELQCFHFIVDQIRRGFYNRSEWRLALNATGQNFADLMEPTNDAFSSIQDLAQEMYRLQHSPSRPRKASTSSSNPKYGESRSIRSLGWARLST